MKTLSLIFLITFFANSFFVQSQTVVGKWKTIDDETRTAKSIVEIYEKSGKYYGKVVEILNPEKRNALCSMCTGEYKNAPILGMVVVKDLIKEGDEFNGGKILDPNKGEEYSCVITLAEKDKLKVRGFVGMTMFGRTQYWYRWK